jgi:NAD-dependent deacetylase
MLSSAFFYSNTEDFYKFYKDKFNLLKFKPNIVHKYLYELEKRGKLKAIVTQNIDGLHTKAGNKNVYEIHGTIYKNHCIKCNKEYSAEFVFNSKKTPKCKCGGIIKPDVVLYGESLDEDVVNGAINAIRNCDTLIIAGTSLNVYPASSYIDYFKGKNLIIINRSETIADSRANIVIHEDMKKVFEKLTI